MPGKRLSSCCQQLVSRLLVYFEEEKRNGSPLISVDAVHERVANALGISMGTVYNIKRKKETTSAVPSSSGSTALYKPRLMPKTCDVSERNKMHVRKVIYEMYNDKKHVTVKVLQEVLEHRNILHTSVSSLRRLLHLLGFKFKKDDNRRALMEKNDISALLHIRSVRKPKGYDGKRYIVLHAATRSGFIQNASLIFTSKSNMGDYHGDMNSDLFTKWVETQLIPNLEEPSIILMDNAPYHSVLIEKSPNQSWTKGNIIAWLNNNNIFYENTMNKSELLEITKRHRKEKVYVIDELLRAHGHEVLRLPPYHCDMERSKYRRLCFNS